MFVLACPRCDDPVRLPDGLDEQATMRCPLCSETIPPHELRELLPPVLQYADDDRATLPIGIDEPWSEGEPSEEGLDEFSPTSDPATPERKIVISPRPSGRDTGGVQAGTRVRSRRGGWKQAVGIIAGGLLALPLAGLLLLAVGKAPDIGYWPFDGSYNGESAGRTAYVPPAGGPKPDAGYRPKPAAAGQSLAAELGEEPMFDPAEAAAAAIVNPDAASDLPPSPPDPELVPEESAARPGNDDEEPLTTDESIPAADIDPVIELPAMSIEDLAPKPPAPPAKPPAKSPVDSPPATDAVAEVIAAMNDFDGDAATIDDALVSIADRDAEIIMPLLGEIWGRSDVARSLANTSAERVNDAANSSAVILGQLSDSDDPMQIRLADRNLYPISGSDLTPGRVTVAIVELDRSSEPPSLRVLHALARP